MVGYQFKMHVGVHQNRLRFQSARCYQHVSVWNRETLSAQHERHRVSLFPQLSIELDTVEGLMAILQTSKLLF